MNRDIKYFKIIHRLLKLQKISSSCLLKYKRYKGYMFFPHIIAMNIIEDSFLKEESKLLIDLYVQTIIKDLKKDFLDFCRINYIKDVKNIENKINTHTIDEWKGVIKNKKLIPFFCDIAKKFDGHEFNKFLYGL